MHGRWFSNGMAALSSEVSDVFPDAVDLSEASVLVLDEELWPRGKIDHLSPIGVLVETASDGLVQTVLAVPVWLAFNELLVRINYSRRLPEGALRNRLCRMTLLRVHRHHVKEIGPLRKITFGSCLLKKFCLLG